MKKLVLSLGLIALTAGAALAQKQTNVKAVNRAAAAETMTAATDAKSSMTVDNIVFKDDSHDFGTVMEGPAADYVFTVTNTGKEPLIINKVQPSCGCTTPDWSKEPIKPGQTGIVKASFGTQGRPGPFNKTLTVMTNAGNKVLTIRGQVEAAPSTSVPENSSMIRTN